MGMPMTSLSESAAPQLPRDRGGGVTRRPSEGAGEVPDHARLSTVEAAPCRVERLSAEQPAAGRDSLADRPEGRSIVPFARIALVGPEQLQPFGGAVGIVPRGVLLMEVIPHQRVVNALEAGPHGKSE